VAVPAQENAPVSDEVVSVSPLTRVRTHDRLRYLEDLLRSFTPLERLALYGLTIILGLSVLAFVAAVNGAISTDIPARGGSITEGETVPARFVNPVLAISQADQDIAMLVYSGLMRARADGTFVPDLADHYSISTDGTTYTFTIRSDATFHDGTPVTAADVLYTVSQAQNPDTKSPRRADWEGVQVSSPDEHTVVFTLPHAYAPFMENATLGILPAHLWRDVPAGQFAFSTYNTHPIGSGPYRVANTQTDATGAATRFELVPFERFTLGSPHLAHINFSFFTSDEALVRALVNGQIDAIAGITPSYLVNLPKTVSLVRSPLMLIFRCCFLFYSVLQSGSSPM
jgi:peptide/nickel transport system substrate-binding protein